MEKTIRILELSFQPTKGSEDRPSKNKWVVETASGNFSIWDSKLAEKLNAKTNQLVSVEVREAQEGTNYLPTITAMNDASDGTVASAAKQKLDQITPFRNVVPHAATQETKTAPNPQRVGLFIKLAVEMMVANPSREGQTVEEDLCENIQEIKKLEEFTVKLLMQDE